MRRVAFLALFWLAALAAAPTAALAQPYGHDDRRPPPPPHHYYHHHHHHRPPPPPRRDYPPR